MDLSNSLPMASDARLRERAAKVIPGGMWGHMNVARLPAGYPQYFDRASGCRLWDVDGNKLLNTLTPPAVPRPPSASPVRSTKQPAKTRSTH